jgi:hypothetical protein
MIYDNRFRLRLPPGGDRPGEAKKYIELEKQFAR